jgi:hypothetical protein
MEVHMAVRTIVANSSEPLSRVLDLLPGSQNRGDYYLARCPAHDDANPSLSVGVGDDGRVLLNCFAGCLPEQVTDALGIKMADLFPSREGGEGSLSLPDSIKQSNTSQNQGLTLETYAKAKRLPEDFLKGEGLTQIYYGGQPVVSIPYYGIDGDVMAVRFRRAFEKGKPDLRFVWKRGDKPSLYGLHRLDLPRQAGYAVVVEGESDCHTAWLHDVPAVGVPGAANYKDQRDAPYFEGIARIYVVVEPDQGGETLLQHLTASSLRDRLYIVRLGGYKDVSELYLDDPQRFPERWEAARSQATRWRDEADQARREAAVEDYQLAAELLQDPELLDRVGRAIEGRGYAGDLQAPMAVYIMATSRLLPKPQNGAVIAPSAAGKNATVDAALALIPPEAICLFRASSARSLVYSDDSYERRIVYFQEADSIPEDGPAASAIRCLAEDNELAYDVVERDERTGQHQTRKIRKPGPTVLITTSTKSLGEQMSTRMLELGVRDDPAQTRAVLQAHALRVSGATRPVVDLEPFHALQRYLEATSPYVVEIPYAGVLADLVPDNAVRMRRDFAQLLTCIQVITLLHVDRRRWRRSEQGTVLVATIDDYREARKILAPVFDTIAAEGVTPAVREAVNTVPEEGRMSLSELASALKIGKSAASTRVKRAIAGGWLVNEELRRGHQAQLIRGAPLPEQTTALPDPERVRQVFECLISNKEEGQPPSPLRTRDGGD